MIAMGRRLKKWGAWLLVVLVALWFFTALGQVEKKSAQQERLQLETALRRAAVTCYACEGYYPESLEALCSRYGIQIDETRFFVHYEVFAENLMPDITVLEREL